jgi:hypothetical protein
MPLTTLTYQDNEQEHRGFADTLGQLQGGIIMGTLTRNTTHAYYAGHELQKQGIQFNGLYLKKDCPGNGQTATGRSQNRIIVAVGTDGKLIENWAVAWRHDDRLLHLSDGFFERAKTMRAFCSK